MTLSVSWFENPREGMVAEVLKGRPVDTGEGRLAQDLDELGRRFDRCRPRLLRECRRFVRDPDVAEDIVQDTFLRARAASHRFDDSRPLFPWLRAIARRLCLDHLRRESPERFVRLEDAGEGLEWASVRDGTWTEVRRGALRGALRRALARLPERQQRMLFLAAVEGRSYTEVAEACGTTEKVVKSTVCRARDRLRLEFRRLGEDGVLGAAPWPVLRPLSTWWRRLRLQARLDGWTLNMIESQLGALFVATVLATTSIIGSDSGVGPGSSALRADGVGAAVASQVNEAPATPEIGARSAVPEVPDTEGEVLLEAGEEAGSPGGEVGVRAGAGIHGGERPRATVETEEQVGEEDGESEIRLRVYCERGSALRKAVCEEANGALRELPAG